MNRLGGCRTIHVQLEVVALIGVLITAHAEAGDVYRWADDHGEIHYSNVPAAVPEGTKPQVFLKTPAGIAPVQGVVVVDDDGDEDEEERVPMMRVRPRKGAKVQLARSAVRREYNETKARLGAIERSLRSLAKARLRHFEHPNASVGGLVAPGATEARSDEEKALKIERDETTARLEKLRTQLRDLR